MQSPKVSVIIPVYNAESSLRLCLESLEASKYQNLEILIGDDGSTDSTRQILEESCKPPRYQVFHFPHSGAAAIRNQLIQKSSGEFLVFQDADDLSDPQRISEQVDFLLKNSEIQAVGTWAKLLDLQGREWGTLSVNPRPTSWDWWLQISFVHATLTIRKSAISSMAYHEGLEYGEDYYFLTSLWKSGVQFANLPKPLYSYRIQPEDLRTRSFRSFTKILKSKWEISKLFPGRTRPLFFVLNLTVLFLSSFRSILKIILIKLKGP